MSRIEKNERKFEAYLLINEAKNIQSMRISSHHRRSTNRLNLSSDKVEKKIETDELKKFTAGNYRKRKTEIRFFFFLFFYLT